MLAVSIVAAIAGLACCIWAAIRIERRSEQWERDNPLESFVTKTYQPATKGRMDFSAFVLVGGFALLLVALIAYLSS